MKIELIGLVEKIRQNSETSQPEKNALKIIGLASSGINENSCYGDFDFPVSNQFYNELRSRFSPPNSPKIKITVETIE
jgi:hypothetical protein